MKGLFKRAMIISILLLFILTGPYGHKPGKTGISEPLDTAISLSCQKPRQEKMSIFSLLLEKAIAYQQAYINNRMSESLFYF
jgi:hypothetical protein